MEPAGSERTRGLAQDVGALLYLDARLLLNRVRLVLRSPRRLFPWLVVFGWFGVARLLRLFEPFGLDRGTGSFSLLSTAAPFVPGAYLLLLGYGVFRAGTRAPATFRSPADARFLIGSRLAPRVVVAWLQVRRVAGLIVAAAFNVLVVVVVVPLGGDSPGQLALLFLAITTAYVTLQGTPMALYLLGRRRSRLPFEGAGAGLMALGAASLVAAFVAVMGVVTWADPVVPLLTHLPPGQWIRDAYHGQLPAAALLLTFAAAAIAVSVHFSGDAYPELWESSSRVFTLRRRLRERGGPVRGSDVRGAHGGHSRRRVTSGDTWVPPGATAILWKEWLALRRGPASLVLQTGVAVGAVTLGIVVGTLTAAGQTQLASTIAVLAGILLLTLNLYPGMRLGAELRNPVWWMSASGLRERLLAWSAAAALRQAIPTCLGCGAALAIAGQPGLLGASLVAVPAATWTLRMVALASYALVPSQTDLRGPGRLLRTLLLAAAVGPMTVVLLVFGAILGSLVAGIVATAIVATAEGWLLLELATSMLKRNGVGYARAETH